MIDWKSNWLGENFSDYEKPLLEKAMNKNAYLLQAKIYKNAFKKYFGLVDDRVFDDVFGGVLYLFIRGFNTVNPSQGVYMIGNEIQC